MTYDEFVRASQDLMPPTSGMLSGIRSSRVATRSAGTHTERLCGHGRAVALNVLAESDARAGLGQDHGSVALRT